VKNLRWKRENQIGGLSLAEIVLIPFIFLMVVVGGFSLWNLLAGPSKKTAAEAPKAEPVGEVATSAPAPSFTIDLTMPLVVIGAAAAGFVFFKFGMPFISRFLTKRREKKDFALTNAKAWEFLRQRKEVLIVEWSKYETDIALMIDFPLMTDYTDPVVQKVVAAMQKLRTAEMMLGDTAAVDAHGSNFEHAVNEFELAFRAAEKHARRHGQNLLTAQEQRRLSTARVALDIIMGETSTGFEIEAAYKTLRSSLKGIIDVPQTALASIEALVRREIVAAPEFQTA
jgi:hypothetical protein